MTPTETLMECMEEFSSSEPTALLVIYTNESGELVVKGDVPRTLGLGLIEAAKYMVLEK